MKIIERIALEQFQFIVLSEKIEKPEDIDQFIKLADYAREKYAGRLHIKPPKELYSRENIDKATKLVNEPRKSQLTNK